MDVRTSRNEERCDNRLSIKTQIAGLREYALEKGYNIYKIYVDEDYSGSNFNRPGFIEMMEDAKGKKINTIIVKDLPRKNISIT